MRGPPTTKDEQIFGYLRRRGDILLPPTLADDVVAAASRTPQESGPRVLPFRTPLLVAAVVLLAAFVTLGGLTMINPQIGDDATLRPSPSEIVPTPSASPDLEASPTATASATQAAAVEAGDVLVAVTDNLVVRSAPSTGDDSEIYSVMLRPGDLLRVIEGPTEGSGFTWFRGAVLDSSAPTGVREGWVAAADQDGTEWLAVVPEEGDGWRFLGEGTSGEDYTVGVATRAEDLDALWADAGIADEAPAIDFDREVVVRYTHAVSFTCPEIDLRGVGVDTAASIVYSVVTRPSSPLFEGQNCTTDGQPHAFVVAVDRGRLPSGEVHFRLQRGFIACADCGNEREQVTIVLP